MATAGGLPVFADTTPWEDAQHELDEAGVTDGLPCVPPTRQRLDRMLADVRDPDRSYGQVLPMAGDLTPAAVAYYAVLAGCRPGELAVALSAVAASLDPDFNLLGLQTTTGSAAVAVIVHGPARTELAMNSGANCLGPGNRANACIGRAVHLALAGLGGAAPGAVDMATIGQPGKYTFCLAEGGDEDFPPFHVRRGFAASQSAVTVVGASGTAEIVADSGATTADAVLSTVAQAMASPAHRGGFPQRPEPAEHFLLLPPELARGFRRQDWTVEKIQAFVSCGDIRIVVAGGVGVKMTHIPPWPGGTTAVTREVAVL